MIEAAAEEPAEILIVDDDPDVRTFVRAVLESDGHRVTEAASGQDAIQRLRIRRPALVLLDVMMPAMDGFAAVHAIKREPGPFVPVILLTALDDPASRAKGINAGADEVLAKPVHPFELRLRCRAMLRIHQLTAGLHDEIALRAEEGAGRPVDVRGGNRIGDLVDADLARELVREAARTRQIPRPR